VHVVVETRQLRLNDARIFPAAGLNGVTVVEEWDSTGVPKEEYTRPIEVSMVLPVSMKMFSVLSPLDRVFAHLSAILFLLAWNIFSALMVAGGSVVEAQRDRR